MKVFARILSKFVAWSGGTDLNPSVPHWHGICSFQWERTKQNHDLKIILLDRLFGCVHFYTYRLPSRITLFTENLQKPWSHMHVNSLGRVEEPAVAHCVCFVSVCFWTVCVTSTTGATRTWVTCLMCSFCQSSGQPMLASCMTSSL